ncbi:Lon protease [Reticulibacter mediterranei]|uniref:Lon protease n=1 Tax=Reticulibacter mediterranei TaxID=2778369 RepID=A0A8J3IMD4_9CHLR|nr:endopeptidase La [Reticulibacter mediterranei]GHO93270.1 Lon protease [Reticulibacter mediterranei]
MNEQERPEIVQDNHDAYPLVALKNLVAFPHNRLALPIAREKSVRAIEEAMMRPDRLLIAATQRSAEIDDPQPQDIYDIGTLVEVSTMHRQQDGSLQVLVRGINRVHVDEYQEAEPFLRVLVSSTTETQVKGPQADALVRHATSLFERYAQLSRRFSVEDINSIVALKTATRLSDTLAAHIVTDMQQQQDLLETFDPLERLEKICVIIGNEIEILELETTIRSRVRSQVDRTQKEFYLREQLRAIQEELGMETSSEADELRLKLKEKSLPAEVGIRVHKEIDRLERTPSQSAEVAVIRSYIDWLLALPWTERSDEIFDIEHTRRILEEDHYGLEPVKERIIDFLAVRQLRQQFVSRGGQVRGEGQGQILCFIGPPGVGKTSLAYSIARALGRKFARISLGGVHDEAEIRGHRRTYVGALPGRIIQSMKTVGVRNPVFLLDEIDKLSSEYRGDPASALLEVLDPEQNSTFVDHYLDLPFDLSEVFFICTGNVKYQIPRPLADRMDIIELPGYMLDEKINIGTRHLLPKVLSEHGLAPDQLKVSQAVMQHIVTDYTREAGVRNLERQLAHICRKVARRVLEKPNTHVKLTANTLKQYLGIPRYNATPPQQRMLIGSAMGLAVTENGGILLPVEVVTMVGKGDLQVTGQLGDVMRESALAALSYIRTRATELNIDPNFQDMTDLHIHLPEGAIPKDGPSAGITIATALISALTRRPVRGDVAMTGEVTLLGSVLAIGGLKEKVLAAQQANITTIIIPAENKKDLAEIPAKIRQRVNFVIVDTMDQVVEAALLPPEPQEEPNEPFPLRLEERVPLVHDNNLRRSGMAQEQQGERDAEGEQQSGQSDQHDESLPPHSRIRARQEEVD